MREWIRAAGQVGSVRSFKAAIPFVLLMLALTACLLAAPMPRVDAAAQMLSRFTYGALPQTVARLERVGTGAWLEREMAIPEDRGRDLQPRLARLETIRLGPRELIDRYGNGKKGSGASEEIFADLAAARIFRGRYSAAQLQEVMTDFWMNHFNVYGGKEYLRWYLPEYERTVIRPHALGNFRELLQAVAHSPAMMLYLDNWVSTGPHSPAARAAARAGRKLPNLNENYGRELLELHTLGVDGGYTQQDVVETARCFSGWTVSTPDRGGASRFDKYLHDDGPKTVLGMQLPAGGGIDDGEKVLDMLARRSATAEFVARKLCRRFVCDDPPRAMVYRVAGALHGSDGDIKTALREMISCPEFFALANYRAKVKTPLELAVSSVRVMLAQVDDPKEMVGALERMGEPLYMCQPPTGYADTAATWLSPGGFLKRLEFAADLCRAPGIRMPVDNFARYPRDHTLVDAIGRYLLGGDMTDTTRAALQKALTSASGPLRRRDAETLIALTLGSPEFQRR